MSLRRSRVTQVGVFLAVLVVACFVALGATGSDGAFAAWCATWLHPAGMFLTAVVAFSRQGPRSVVGWALASGTAAGLLGAVLYRNDPSPPSPSLADPLWLTVYPLVAAALVQNARRYQLRLSSGSWIDGLTTACLAASLWALVVLEPLRATATDVPLRDLAVTLAYPVADLLLVATLAGVWAVRGWRLDRSLALFGAAIMLYTVADSLWALRLAHGQDAHGGLFVAAWISAFVALSMTTRASSPSARRRQSRSASVLPALLGLSGTGVLVWTALGDAEPLALVLGGAATALAALRFAVTSIDNADLLAAADERFRCSFDEARIGMLIIDLDSRYERVNDAFCAIVGYSHEQLTGISRASITHPDDRAADAAAERALLAGEARSHMCEKRYIHASGDVIWAAINLTLICDADAQPLHFIAQVQDITERRNDEELLERQHQKLMQAQRVGGFGTWEWVIASDTIEWSDELSRMYGVEPGVQPRAAEKVVQCIHADDRVRLQAHMQDCLDSGEPLDLELRVVLPSGVRRVAHVRGMVIADEAGVALRVVGTAQDITARYELERAKAEFLSIVSHELRTPLTCIHGALGLLKSGSLGTMSQGGQRMVDIALQNSDRLGRLINDILDVERIDSTEISMRRVSCNADDLIARATDAVASAAAAAEISVVVDAQPVPLSADSDRIIQMLTNLISNAVKFSPANSSVRVSCSGSDGGALFEVCDQGRGIPAEHLESIFERFRQVDASDSRQKGGTGLGLAICRSIIEQHGGRIWARSNPGDGATFSFTVPAPTVSQPGPARLAASR